MARAIDVKAEEWVVAPSDRKLPEDAPDRTRWLISHPTPNEAARAQDEGAEYLPGGSVRVRTGTLDLWAIRYYLHEVEKFPGENDEELEIAFTESPHKAKKRKAKVRVEGSGGQNSVPVADSFIRCMGSVLMHEVAGMILGDVPTEADAEK